MSKRETPMTRWYWQQVGGTLCEEFRAVKRTASSGQRLLDGLILPDGPNELVHWRDVEVRGRDIIVVQTKAERLGMYLSGQAFFSAKLMEAFRPRSIRTVALCKKDDSVIRPLVEAEGVEVVVVPEDACS